MARPQPQSMNAITPIAFEILLSLAQGPQHGYGIKLSIEERTAGELTLGSGTLYQAIQRLERSEMIAVAEGVAGSEDPRRGRFYRLEPAGKAALKDELRRLNRVVEYARARDLLPDLPAP
jgi:DNA-binding PadR family transcriptional regulator